MAAAIWWEGKFSPLRAGKVSPNLHLVDKKRKMWPNLKKDCLMKKESKSKSHEEYLCFHTRLIIEKEGFDGLSVIRVNYRMEAFKSSSITISLFPRL